MIYCKLIHWHTMDTMTCQSVGFDTYMSTIQGQT